MIRGIKRPRHWSRKSATALLLRLLRRKGVLERLNRRREFDKRPPIARPIRLSAMNWHELRRLLVEVRSVVTDSALDAMMREAYSNIVTRVLNNKQTLYGLLGG